MRLGLPRNLNLSLSYQSVSLFLHVSIMSSLPMIRSRSSSSLLLLAVLLLIVSPLSILASCHSRPSTSDRYGLSYSSTNNDDLPSQQDFEAYGLIPAGPQASRRGGGNREDRLDGTIRTGSNAEKGWVDPNLGGGSMLDVSSSREGPTINSGTKLLS